MPFLGPRAKGSADYGTMRRVMVVLAVFLAGFNMRAALVSVIPLLEIVRVDLGTNRTVVGLLTTVPVLLMGLCAPLAPRIAGRMRLEIAVVLTLALIGVSAFARFWGGPIVLFVTAALLGLAIAIGQPLVMGFTKTHHASHVAMMAGIYAAGINLGAAVAARSALPAYELAGNWRAPLGMWFVPAMLTAVLWSALATRSVSVPRPARDQSVWRVAKAWVLAFFFSVAVLVYYAVLTWLAPLFIDHGLSADEAAVFLSLFALFQLPGTLLFPWLAGRRGTFGPWLVVTVVMTTVGLVLAALGTVVSPWVTTVILGVGTGGLFPLCLALPVAHTQDAQMAASLSAIAFTLGYALGAIGPSLLGWLRDETGDFLVAFLTLATLSAVQLVLVPRVVPPALSRREPMIPG